MNVIGYKNASLRATLAALVLFALSSNSNATTMLSATVSCMAWAVYESDYCGDGSTYAEAEFEWEGKAQAHAEASVQIDFGYGDIGINLVALAWAGDQFYANAFARGTGGFSDTLTVGHGGTLDYGTQVLIRAIHELKGSVSSHQHANTYSGTDSPPFSAEIKIVSSLTSWQSINVYHALNSTSESYVDAVSLIDTMDDLVRAHETWIWAAVGDSIEVSYVMDASCGVYVSQPTMHIDDASLAHCGINAGGSGHTYFEVLTPGAFLLSESGHDYTPITSVSAVPEPGTFVLLGIGAVALGFVFRRNPAESRVA